MKHLFISLLALLAFTCTSIKAGQDQKQYKRIVTLGGSVTEIVFTLGAGDNVVGVDESSLYPFDKVSKLPKVGYVRTISAEGVLSLRPDLIITYDDAGPAEEVKQLESVGIKIVKVPNEHSLEGVKNKIQIIAAALGLENKGKELAQKIDGDYSSLKKKIANQDGKKKVLFIYARGQSILNVAGNNTAADAMIELAGGENAIQGYEGYKPLTSEALVSAQPDIILLTKTGIESINGKGALNKFPGVQLTPAGKNGDIIVMDDLLLLGFTPRITEALAELNEKIYSNGE
jgi:iron complex transport system substrate-binding protein